MDSSLLFFSNQILLSATLLSCVLVKVGFGTSFDLLFDCKSNEKLYLSNFLYKLIIFPSRYSLACINQTILWVF